MGGGRVVITGVGPVASIGIGRDAFSEGLRTGRSGSSPIASFDTRGFPSFHACEVRDFAPLSILKRLDADDWGRSSLFAACAARLAIEDATLDLARVEPERVGTVCGTTCGESQLVELLTAQALAGGLDAMDPAVITRSDAARLALAVSEELAIEGESVTLSTACAAGNYAIGYAFDAIRSGAADVMLAGGAESVCRWVHAGFYRLGTVERSSCAPFDRDRAGILTAEGGAMLVLESLDHALARGARPLAEVLGYGSNCDADHMVAPNAASIARCMRLALASAQIDPSRVDYICAHGTGTPANDAAEVLAIRDVYGAKPPPISSIKSMLGHTMGAASAFGAIASTLALVEGFLPPTINLRSQDPSMVDLDLVPNHASSRQPSIVQNDGFAFGGSNTITLFGLVA